MLLYLGLQLLDFFILLLLGLAVSCSLGGCESVRCLVIVPPAALSPSIIAVLRGVGIAVGGQWLFLGLACLTLFWLSSRDYLTRSL